MHESSTPTFDAIKKEQGADDSLFLPFKTHEEFMAEQEHETWLAMVLTILDDQQMHRPDGGDEAVHSVNEVDSEV